MYTKLRWKYKNEKKIKTKADKERQALQSTQEESSVKLFLHEECVASKFKKDYIMIPDLLKAYNFYCSN